MTIKELEERLGLPRASIRYYEQEGLLTPARGANGYRNYSEEDLRTLEKIKLLRQLHLDLETIRALQRGELTLDAALARQLAGLGEDRAALDRAEAVCRALRDAGESYAKLDPKPWLDQLTRPPLPAAPHFPPPAETRRAPEPLPVAPCPIRRWLARWLDLGLYGLPWILLRSLALHVPSVENGVLSWLEGYLSIALMFLLEPLLLHYWGWTPGKWLLGLKVRDRAGEKLSLKRAFQRTWRLFGRGYGYQIPIYNLYRMWCSYRACREGEYLEWDQDPDLPAREDIRYEMLPLKALKGLGYGAAQAALLGCTVPGRPGRDGPACPGNPDRGGAHPQLQPRQPGLRPGGPGDGAKRNAGGEPEPGTGGLGLVHAHGNADGAGGRGHRLCGGLEECPHMEYVSHAQHGRSGGAGGRAVGGAGGFGARELPDSHNKLYKSAGGSDAGRRHGGQKPSRRRGSNLR